MPLPEGYLPRRGDVLVLHGTVKYDVRNDVGDHDEDGQRVVFVRLVGDYSDRRVPLDTVVGVARRTFKQGERVRYWPSAEGDPPIVGEVIAAHEDMAWVKRESDGQPITLRANDLEPVPEEVAEVPPAPPKTWESDQGPRPITQPEERADGGRPEPPRRDR